MRVFVPLTPRTRNIGSGHRSGAWALLFAVAFGTIACGGDDDDAHQAACLTTLPTDCSQSLEPKFDVLYEQVFSASCGAVGDGTSCHGSMGKKGGLGLFNADTAYDGLSARVMPGDAKCSILMQRLESSDASFRMPLRDKPLPPGIRCAIQHWIDSGAARQ